MYTGVRQNRREEGGGGGKGGGPAHLNTEEDVLDPRMLPYNSVMTISTNVLLLICLHICTSVGFLAERLMVVCFGI